SWGGKDLRVRAAPVPPGQSPLPRCPRVRGESEAPCHPSEAWQTPSPVRLDARPDPPPHLLPTPRPGNRLREKQQPCSETAGSEGAEEPELSPANSKCETSLETKVSSRMRQSPIRPRSDRLRRPPQLPIRRRSSS